MKHRGQSAGRRRCVDRLENEKSGGGETAEERVWHSSKNAAVRPSSKAGLAREMPAAAMILPKFYMAVIAD
jgi:hypothetical protein